ncbi:MAG TPA: hypothetical protein VK589_02565, partial [Chryseolinea sp.]|nr:hypothetical protein [Chryseolinea sp.]
MSIDSYLKSAVVILSAALIGGCTFEPHNENINPIKPPEPIVFSIEVNDPNFTDPYYLVLPTLFTFTLKDLPQPVCYYDVYLDGGTHITSGEAHDRISFQMIPGAYTDGIHEVTIKIRVPTNSGSLAEKFDSEFHLTEIKFKVIIDRTTPTFAAPPTVAYENGFLTVRWGAAPRRNFFYVIKRTYEPYNPLMDSLIFNPSQNSFVDRGFVGGDITYKILASGYGFQDVEVGTIRFNDSPVDFKIVRKDQLVYLSWSQSEIGLEDTKITSSANGTEVTLPHTESAEILIDSLVMGEEENYFIKTVRDRYP